MLTYIFGEVKTNSVNLLEPHTNAGYLELEKARVRWFLSEDDKNLPKEIVEKGQRTFRSITIDGEKIEFSDGFTDLHTLVYKDILTGKGFSLEDARPSIEIVHHIRNSKAIGLKGDYHPFLKSSEV